jgi:hypothetical protein
LRKSDDPSIDYSTTTVVAMTDNSNSADGAIAQMRSSAADCNTGELEVRTISGAIAQDAAFTFIVP